ncbi:MAG: VWA domain-containing protein [Gemmataceae bacterium]|nr:VWA domain-containing protein [Gemmata sp.]MDW8197192.1 VWA domain-containing protein [Gemmataceae bacterium]
MLDVFCCALGCVSLLFLINSRMASDAVEAQNTLNQQLAATEWQLTDALGQLHDTQSRLTTIERQRSRLAAQVTALEERRHQLMAQATALSERLAATQAEKDDLAKQLATARADAQATQTRLATTTQELAITRRDLAATQERLQKKLTELDILTKKDAAATLEVDRLQKLLRHHDDQRLALESRVATLKKELAEVQAKGLATQKELQAQIAAAHMAAKAAAEELASAHAALKTATEQLTAAKAQASKNQEELGATRLQIQQLTKTIDEARATIIDLQGEKAKLADQFHKFQKETEARFAGIAMTGKKVVFIVDMSGSMGKRDLTTLDTSKWPLVVETVCKVMRSIPTLEAYQVIVFSSSAHWLFGSGQWRTFTGEPSVEAVREALLQVKPKDDTNMYAAFEKAFSLRATGLDTIYLFSDGLPTSGEGLTPAQENLSEQERGALLGKYVREKLSRSWNRAENGQPRVKINSIGFYFESPDVGAFLWSLSRENDGSFVGMSKP